MVIDELLKKGIETLGSREYTNPQNEVRMILSKLLDVDKSYIYINGDREVSKDIGDKFFAMIDLRKSGYPIQYIMKEKEFMGLDLYIEEGVLVPRADTEILAEYIIDYIQKKYNDEKIKVMDMGAGSGAISLSIARYCKNAYVYGADIGDIPIRVSNINKERLDLKNVEFVKGDLFEPFKNEIYRNSFHIIASNPPYISNEELENLQTEVRDFEPRLALEAKDEGLDFYKRISLGAKDYLVNDGLLIYEIGYNQGEAVSNILEANGYRDIKILKDLQMLDRVVLGIK